MREFTLNFVQFSRVFRDFYYISLHLARNKCQPIITVFSDFPNKYYVSCRNIPHPVNNQANRVQIRERAVPIQQNIQRKRAYRN